MTRESMKRAIDVMPDKEFEALTSAITTLFAFADVDDKKTEVKKEEWEPKKLPDKITSFSQLIGMLPPMSLEEIRDMRLADKEKRLME
jgi:hypothetical protein